MADVSLHGCRVLVAEDEYMLAEDLRISLENVGAVVLGPVPSVDEGLAMVAEEPTIDGAALDVNLDGEKVFPLADALADRGVQFVFTTGYEQAAIPERYSHVPRCEKPINIAAVARAIRGGHSTR